MYSSTPVSTVRTSVGTSTWTTPGTHTTSSVPFVSTFGRRWDLKCRLKIHSGDGDHDDLDPLTDQNRRITVHS